MPSSQEELQALSHVCSPMASQNGLCLKAIDVAVGFQAGEQDVEKPQSQEEQSGE